MACLRGVSIMGSIQHLYDVFAKMTNGESGKCCEGMPKIPALPNFHCDAEPHTAEYRIYHHQLRKQKDDFHRDMADYAARMEKVYKKR